MVRGCDSVVILSNDDVLILLIWFLDRAQAVQLMQKLHKARVFEDVRGAKHNKIDFADNGRLFR
jgi:hypothetical protein